MAPSRGPLTFAQSVALAQAVLPRNGRRRHVRGGFRFGYDARPRPLLNGRILRHQLSH